LFVQKEIELSSIPCFLALFLSAYSLVYCGNEYERILNENIVSGAALSAASSPLGVVTGAIAGHGVATVVCTHMNGIQSGVSTLLSAIARHLFVHHICTQVFCLVRFGDTVYREVTFILCLQLAVLGGSFLGTYISEKVNSPLILILHSVFHSLRICAL
jgi:hypothetical protein